MELVCLVQHKKPPRFFRYVCCEGYEEVDTICARKYNTSMNIDYKQPTVDGQTHEIKQSDKPYCKRGHFRAVHIFAHFMRALDS